MSVCDRMSKEIKSLNDSEYIYFEALSHPTRVRILSLIGEKELTFSSLKHELEIGSSGELQHHMQKLSNFVMTENKGSYDLTDEGRRALELYSESKKSGRSLEAICCIPHSTERAHNNQISPQRYPVKTFHRIRFCLSQLRQSLYHLLLRG